MLGSRQIPDDMKSPLTCREVVLYCLIEDIQAIRGKTKDRQEMWRRC